MTRGSTRTIVFDGPAPEIVCVIGTDTFEGTIALEVENLTMLGVLVLSSVSFVDLLPEEGTAARKRIEARRHELMLRRIDMSDRVVAICPDGVTGPIESYIEYADAHQVPVSYLFPVSYPNGTLHAAAHPDSFIERLSDEAVVGYTPEQLATRATTEEIESDH